MDRGVFYPNSGHGEAWNGLLFVDETPVDSKQRQIYQDGRKLSNGQSSGYFAGRIEAFSYPPSFYSDILTKRRPNTVSFCYRTKTKDHYKIHIVYNVLLAPSAYIHQQSLFETYSWSFTTLPIDIPGAGRSSHLVVETAIAYSWVIEALEDILYGTDSTNPRLPSPNEIIDLFEANAILRIIDHGDGTWSAIGPDSAIQMLDANTFEINWPSAVYLSADSYTISTL